MNPWRRMRHVFPRPQRCILLTGLALALLLVSAGSASAAAAKAGASANADNANANANADADAVTFDRSLLSGGGSNTVDLARFEKGQIVLPGLYNVDLYVNNVAVGRANVRFAARPGHPHQVRPCFDPALLQHTRLQPVLSATIKERMQQSSACVTIGELVPGASTQFDLGELRLDISVPQASMHLMPRGYVAPENLTDGVNAALVNYNFNTYRTRSLGVTQTSAYLNLAAGLNLGRWRFRHKSALVWQAAAGDTPAQHRWQNIESYVQRDIEPLHAQLTVGDTYTSGDLFDSMGLSGVMLSTDERMLPSSLRGYAPVVRGVARTNAKVTIRQNGVLLYQTTVAPGPFQIDDLYPTGSGGDLDVEVDEADGSVRHFSVPYASVQQLLRSGTTRFQLASGHLRNQGLTDRPLVTEGTLRHGFSNLFTGYTGVVGTRGYFAFLAGGAFNTRWGALAADVTSARTKIPGVATLKGHSYRLTYSKILPVTDTSVSVAAYRYSTRGYLGLNDAMMARDYARRGLQVFATAPQTLPVNGQPPIPGLPGIPGTLAPASLYTGGIDRPRNRFSITLNQRLGRDGGSFYLNASTRDYWNRSQHDTQFQVGYNNHFHSMGFNISATRTRDAFGRSDTQLFASFNIPLGDSSHAPMLNASLARDSQRHWREMTTLSGNGGDQNQFTYNATASHDGSTGDSALSVNSGYRSPYAVLHASAGKGRGYTQASVSVAGAVVAHPGGITFGQPTGDTIGIVVAKHAAGTRVNNAVGGRVGPNGYALVPYLTPYAYNTVNLDPRGLPLDVQLDATSTRVAPRAGAVVMIPFQTQYGRSLIVQAQLSDGKPLPFGARVSNARGHDLGVVGQGGQMLIRGVDEHGGDALVHWSDDAGKAHSCRFPYPAAGARSGQRRAFIDTVCRPVNGTPGGKS